MTTDISGLTGYTQQFQPPDPLCGHEHLFDPADDPAQISRPA